MNEEDNNYHDELTDKRGCKGIWIPIDIYLSRDVCWSAKIIFLEIDSFTQKNKKCYFSNEYLAKFLNISITQVSVHINKLKEIGWIEEVSFDGRRRFLRSCLEVGFKAGLKKTLRQDISKPLGRVKENFKAGLKKTLRQENENTFDSIEENVPKTPSNNIDNNIYNNINNNIIVSDETSTLKNLASLTKEGSSFKRGSKNKGKSSAGAEARVPSSQIVAMINMFKDINPLNYESWFSIKSYRRAVAEVIEKMGFEEAKESLRICLMKQDKYIPITTPIEFKKNAHRLAVNNATDKTLIGVKF